MRTAAFAAWLRDTYRTRKGTPLEPNPQNDALRRCERVEKKEGDLDQHFTNDRLQNLLTRLTYSSEDAAARRPPKHRIVIDGDIRNGTASLRSAIMLYQSFCRNCPPPTAADSAT